MKNSFYLFVVQTMIAIGRFGGVTYLVKALFLKDSKVQTYLALDSGVKKMARFADILMDSLIAQNDLTFEPSRGKSMDRVLKNLKYSKWEKLLMVGYSQSRVLQGENLLGAYQKLVSRRIRMVQDTIYIIYP